MTSSSSEQRAGALSGAAISTSTSDARPPARSRKSVDEPRVRRGAEALTTRAIRAGQLARRRPRRRRPAPDPVNQLLHIELGSLPQRRHGLARSLASGAPTSCARRSRTRRPGGARRPERRFRERSTTTWPKPDRGLERGGPRRMIALLHQLSQRAVRSRSSGIEAASPREEFLAFNRCRLPLLCAPEVRLCSPGSGRKAAGRPRRAATRRRVRRSGRGNGAARKPCPPFKGPPRASHFLEVFLPPASMS